MIFCRFLLTCLAVRLCWAKTWSEIRSETDKCNVAGIRKGYSCSVDSKSIHPIVHVQFAKTLVQQLGTKYQFGAGNLNVDIKYPTTSAAKNSKQDISVEIVQAKEMVNDPCDCQACKPKKQLHDKKMNINMPIIELIDNCIIPRLKGKNIEPVPQDSVLILNGLPSDLPASLANDASFYWMDEAFMHGGGPHLIGVDFQQFLNIEEQMSPDEQQRYKGEFDSIVFSHGALSSTNFESFKNLKLLLRKGGKIYIPNSVSNYMYPAMTGENDQQYEARLRKIESYGIKRIKTDGMKKSFLENYGLAIDKVEPTNVPTKIQNIFESSVLKKRYKILDFYVLEVVDNADLRFKPLIAKKDNSDSETIHEY